MSNVRSAVVMYASDQLLRFGTYQYPAPANATIALLVEDGAINEWVDTGGGVWTYSPGGNAYGTLTYTSVDPFSTYAIAQALMP